MVSVTLDYPVANQYRSFNNWTTSLIPDLDGESVGPAVHHVITQQIAHGSQCFPFCCVNILQDYAIAIDVVIRILHPQIKEIPWH